MCQLYDITESINAALDSSYKKTAGQMLAQVTALSRGPNSQLQRALKVLDEEAKRLEADGKKMTIDNPVLKEALRVVELTFNLVASLIQANDNVIEATGKLLAVNAVTAKVFLNLSRQVMGQGVDPVSAQAMKYYREQIKKSGIKWQT